MDRDELLRQEEERWRALEAAVGAVPQERRMEVGVVPGWSVRDLVWHCARWSDYAGERLSAIASGTYVHEDHPDAFYDDLNARWAEEAKAVSAYLLNTQKVPQDLKVIPNSVATSPEQDSVLFMIDDQFGRRAALRTSASAAKCPVADGEAADAPAEAPAEDAAPTP